MPQWTSEFCCLLILPRIRALASESEHLLLPITKKIQILFIRNLLRRKLDQTKKVRKKDYANKGVYKVYKVTTIKLGRRSLEEFGGVLKRAICSFLDVFQLPTCIYDLCCVLNRMRVSFLYQNEVAERNATQRKMIAESKR